MRVSDKGKQMPGDFFDPTPEEQRIVLVGRSVLREAERLIATGKARKSLSITSLIASPDRIQA